MTRERDSDHARGGPPGSDAPTEGASGEERYRKIFEYSNDAVMIVDLETESFVDVNPTACELLGYSREELLSMHPEAIHPGDIERVREEFISQVVADGAGFTDDLTCLTKDGAEVPTEISGAGLGKHEDGSRPTRMVAMLRDVSDRAEYRRALEERIERLDRFASVVSHDLRNPLSVIDGHATLARETGDPAHFDAIDAAVDRMDEMLSELLRLTREGSVIGDRTSVDVGALARRAWTDRASEASTLDVVATPTVSADRDRLYELFENLFENALEHGGSDVTVRVGPLDDGDASGFYVEDDGPGIPVDERDTVFEWGHTTTTEGTGFGLAIVAEIADAHGWETCVHDAETGGARFEITGVSTTDS